MGPAQRPRGARAVVFATLVACVALSFLGSLSGRAVAAGEGGSSALERSRLGAAGGGPALRGQPSVDPSGPTAVVTAPALASTTSRTASFKVSWSASPALPSGGWDAYRVEYREPGMEYWLTWKAATTALSATFPGEPGHAYLFRAAAAKSGDATTVGPWSAEKAATAPDDEARFTYTKTWTRTSVSSAYYGKVRSCATKGATATYTLAGTSAALIAPRGPALGKVAVYVRSALEGGGWTAFKLVKTVDLYARTSRARVATAFGDWDPSVQRQVKFVVTGTKNRASASTKVSLDGLAVFGAPRYGNAHSVDIGPEDLSVVITEQLQLTASIPSCVDQRVEWVVYRKDAYDAVHMDDAGTITADGLYTAPLLPTDSSYSDDYRRYYVQAHGLANPDHVLGQAEIVVRPGPAPEVDSISPLTGPAGTPVTLTGRHFTDHGGVPQVLFQGVEATVTSYTDSAITAIVPGGWQTWETSQRMYVWVRVWKQDSEVTAGHLFTVTGILPMPPSPWSNGINGASTDDDNASVGDVVRIYGNGFAPKASDNLVRFGGGVVVAADRYEPDPYWQNVGTVFVTVPPGAASGALGFQRLDGDGRWNDDGPILDVRPATTLTAALHPVCEGVVTGPRLARNGTWGYEDWVVVGGDFTKVRAYPDLKEPGTFWLDMRRGGVTRSLQMRAVSDTLAVARYYRDRADVVPDEIFATAQPGDTVELRVRGFELSNQYERSSAWFPVSLGERPVYGAVHQLNAATVLDWGAGRTIAKGSWLRLYEDPTRPTQQLTAPGLWSGALPFGAGGFMSKLVRLDTPGTYTITNQASGEATTLVVADVGEYASVSVGVPVDSAEGCLFDCAGARVDVPPGAFWAGDLGPYDDDFEVRLYHDPSGALPWDATLTDGGHAFTLDVWPYVTRLLKPITVTVPYDPAGRTTTPFLGMWDEASGLYYDFRLSDGEIDTVAHTLTYVVPAGDYVHPSDYYGRAAARAKTAVAPPGDITFNQAFRKAGAVSSKVATSGDGFVWHSPDDEQWGVRLDVITDPAASGYVAADKAQEILDAAAATWTNLVGHGWSQPEAMITITVRDYGDPGVYQGSTTKGVFGQPWVYVNSRVQAGPKLGTAVAHEMGHVFQRQLTTNITTKWIDEAVAEWVAFDTLGASGTDFKASFEAGCDFPTVQFPSGFWAGYTPEQAYGAGAFIIWLARAYGEASVLAIYDDLAYAPDDWYDSAATFYAATGRTLAELTSEFATEFWLQTYDPIKPYEWWSRATDVFTTHGGRTVSVGVPKNASRGYAVAAASAFRPTVLGSAMVARAPGVPVGARIDVYRDTATTGQVPAAPFKLGTLTSDVPVLDLGVYDASLGCYRLVAVPPVGGALSVDVTIEAVHVDSVSPASVPKGGGTAVTVSGSGFGDQKGIVMVGPAIVTGAAVTQWSDTRIVFTMPNMGSETGVQPLDVRPVTGGTSNAVGLTVY